MALTIALQKEGVIPLHRQVYQGVQRLILSEIWKPGKRLPSTRDLACRLGVSRTTICTAYDKLLEDGYVQSHVGSGTFVSHELADRRLIPTRADRVSVEPVRPVAGRLLSSFGEFLEASTDSAADESVRDDNDPAASSGSQIWLRALARQVRHAWSVASDPQGDNELREALADYLARARGLDVEAGQIILTGSREEALSLVVRIHVSNEDLIAVEDPCDPALVEILLSHGADVDPLPVDALGLVVGRLTQSEHLPPKMLFISPSCQNPTGVSLSRSRRSELVSWCVQARTLVVEDDTGHELSYAGQAIRSLQGLAGAEHVIYLGGFSTAIPSVKSAYLVVPESLIPVYRRAKRLIGSHGFLPEQKALSELISRGLFDRIVRKLRQDEKRSRQNAPCWELGGSPARTVFMSRARACCEISKIQDAPR